MTGFGRYFSWWGPHLLRWLEERYGGEWEVCSEVSFWWPNPAWRLRQRPGTGTGMSGYVETTAGGELRMLRDRDARPLRVQTAEFRRTLQ